MTRTSTMAGFLGGLGCLGVLALGLIVLVGIMSDTDASTPTRDTKDTMPDRSAPRNQSPERELHTEAQPEPQPQRAEQLVSDEYILYAAIYLEHDGAIPLLHGDHAGYGIGTLPDRYEVLQIINASALLLDAVDRHGLRVSHGVWVSNISTDGVVDGQAISFHDDALFWGDGTVTYDTAGGGTRTVYSVAAIDKDLLEEAMVEVKRQFAETDAIRQEERQQRIDAARLAVTAAERNIEALHERHAPVAEYLRLQKEIELYVQAGDRPRIRQHLDRLRSQLDEIDEPAPEAASAYQSERDILRSRLHTARMDLLEARRQ